MLEKEVLKSVLNKLSSWQSMGDIIWFTRLNSGRIKTEYGTWLKLCDIGTPDIVVILRSHRGNNLNLVFIETKRNAKQKLRPEQAEFRSRFLGMTDVWYLVIHDVNDLIENIENLIPDRLKDIAL